MDGGAGDVMPPAIKPSACMAACLCTLCLSLLSNSFALPTYRAHTRYRFSSSARGQQAGGPPGGGSLDAAAARAALPLSLSLLPVQVPVLVEGCPAGCWVDVFVLVVPVAVNHLACMAVWWGSGSGWSRGWRRGEQGEAGCLSTCRSKACICQPQCWTALDSTGQLNKRNQQQGRPASQPGAPACES